MKAHLLWLMQTHLWVPRKLQQTHNVTSMLLQHRCNVMTLQQCCNDVVTTLCVYWDFSDFSRKWIFRDSLGKLFYLHYENTHIQIYWKSCHQKMKIFHISVQNIDCGYLFCLSRNKKNSVYPCKPQFYYIKVGFKGVKIILACFRNVMKMYLVCTHYSHLIKAVVMSALNIPLYYRRLKRHH